MTDIRIGQGYDVHCIGDGGRMCLCGITVAEDRCFIAHSDGDVAIHALCDALLGALALGDIGKYFPPSDPEWKGIDSKVLLRKVMEMIRSRGYDLGNADITVALQAPKIGSLVPRMCSCLAGAMEVDVSRVSVKATTTEGLGFVGRGEGCAVWAVVTVVKG